MQSRIFLILFMTVFSFATQTLGIILSNSSPQNGSIIWLSTSGDTVTEVFCQFIRETTAGRGIVGWFVNGEEITYHREQFHGVQFSANDPNRQATSTLTVKIVATEKEEILYLNDGSITCYPPGNYGGTVFGLFRTFVAGYGMPTNNTDIDMPTISNTSNDTADVPTVFPTVVYLLPEYIVNEDDQIVSVCISTNEPFQEEISLTTRDDSAIEETVHEIEWPGSEANHINHKYSMSLFCGSVMKQCQENSGEDYVTTVRPQFVLLENTCVNISITIDNMVEGNEEFHVDIYLGAIESGILLNSTTVVIIDSLMTIDPTMSIEVTFEESSYTAIESDKFVTVCLQRLDLIAKSIVVNLTTFDNISVAGEDYEALQSYSLTLGGAGSRCANITIISDNRVEGPENFAVRADSTDGSAFTTVVIIDSNVCPDGDVQLVTREGFDLVEICCGGAYLPLCHEQWDNIDAAVVCRQSKHTQFSVAVPNSGITSQRRAITNMTCVGTETHASNCVYSTTEKACQQAAVECNSPSPCPKQSFWCPESSYNDPTCIPRESVCDGLRDCSSSNADERVCAVVTFTRDSYTIEEDGDPVLIHVCAHVLFPTFSLFTRNMITLILYATTNTSGSKDVMPSFKRLNRFNFIPSNNTQCGFINAVLIQQSSFLVLSPEENLDFYISTRQSKLTAPIFFLNGDGKDGDVKPIYLTERDLIVKIYNGGSYHHVCHDSWDHREASVVCRQLNISHAGIVSYIPQIVTTTSELDAYLVNDIFCFGNETSINKCRKIEDSDCSSVRTVAVRCTDSNRCNDGERRIVKVPDGNGDIEGRIEVCLNSVWGTASMNKAPTYLAGVICKYLGYEASGAAYEYPARPNPHFQLLPIIWPVQIDCTAPSSTFDKCTIEHLVEDIPSPPQASVAGFQCRAFSRDNCTEGDVRISEVYSLHESITGLPEVCTNNSWNKLCGPDASDSVANVICRQLGFHGGHFFSTSPEFRFSPPLPITALKWSCNGNETHLQECANLSSLPDGRVVEDPDLYFIGIECTDLPTLFLHTPSESLFDRDTYIVKEGRSFELQCSTSRSNGDIVTLKHNGNVIQTGIGSVSIMKYINTFDAGNYTCGFVTAENFTAERHFRIIVNSATLGEHSSSTFRISVPSTEKGSTDSLRQLILALISNNYEGIQEVNCSLLKENMRPEDVESQLYRVECVVLNFPPVDDFDNFVNSIIQILPKLSPMLASPSASGEGFCNAEMINNVSWPETPSGSGAVVITCPGNKRRNVTRRCVNATWSIADYNTCLQFSDIPTFREDNIFSNLRKLNSVLAGATLEEQNEANAELIAILLEELAALLEEEGTRLSTENMTEVVNSVVEILDALLQWDPEILRNYGSRNVRSFESILVSLITSPDFDHQAVVEDDIVLLTRTVMPESLNSGMSFKIVSLNERPMISSSVKGEGEHIAAISIPPLSDSPQVMYSHGPLTVAIAVYEEPVFFPLSKDDIGLETRVGTPIVSLLVARDREQIEIDDLKQPIVLNLAVTQINAENVTRVRCVFWDFTTEGWSTDGCKTQISDDKSQVTCTCTHLTNFAALVDVCRRTEGCETSTKAEYALSIVSIVGVTISLMGVTVTFFTMLFFKTLRKRDISKYHVQLCIAMFSMLLVFLVGINKTSVKGGCVTVSVLIHYFTLASVMWMGAEAVLMFQKLVLVFVRITTRHIIAVSFICWLVPLLPVVIAVAIKPDHVVTKDKEDSLKLCFIGNTATFFATFLGPVLAIVLCNCVIFFIVITVLVRHKRQSKVSGLKMKKSKGRDSTIRLLISIACIMSLFGVTWIFGALTVDKASLAFQVIFVILNSLQGFFIFLFLCVLGRDARELWLEVLCCGRYKSSHLHPSSVATSSAKKKCANSDLLSANTSSTAVQTIEKAIVLESVTYSINIVEFTDKADVNKEEDSVTSDSDDRSTPELTGMDFEVEEKDSEKHANGSPNTTVNGGGHSLESIGSEKHHDELTDWNKGDLQSDVQFHRYSTLKGMHHVERFELDFKYQ